MNNTESASYCNFLLNYSEESGFSAENALQIGAFATLVYLIARRAFGTSPNPAPPPSTPPTLSQQIEHHKTSLPPSSATIRGCNLFSVVLGDSFNLQTPLAGASTDAVLNHWIQLLESMAQVQVPFSAGLSPQDRTVLIELYRESLENYAHLKAGKDEDLIKALKKQIEHRGYCILPLEYLSTGSSTPHVFACVLKKDPSGQLIGYFLNRGEGNHYHPPVEGKEPTVKRNYRSMSFRLKDGFLDENRPETRLFFSNLCRYARETPSTLPYVTDEIYEFFLWEEASIEPCDNEIIDPNEGVTAQRGGTCPEQLARALLRHYLLNTYPDKAEAKRLYKRTILWEKYDVLCKALDSFKRATFSRLNRKEAREFLEELAREFALSLNKSHEAKTISFAEMLPGHALLSQIKEELETAKTPPAPLVPFIQTVPLDLLNVIMPSKIPPLMLSQKTPLNDYPIDLPSITPDPTDLWGWLKSIPAHPAIISAYLNALPIPGTAEGEEFWKKVPSNTIYVCVNRLCELLNSYNNAQWISRIGPKGTIYSNLLMQNLSVLTIVDALLLKVPQMCLQGFTVDLPFWLLHQKLHFHQGKDQERLRRIRAYWNPRSLCNHKLFTLAPMWELKPLGGRWITRKQLMNTLSSSVGSKNNLVAKAHYLGQFLKDENQLFAALNTNSVSPTVPTVFNNYEQLAYNCVRLLYVDFEKMDTELMIKEAITFAIHGEMLYDTTQYSNWIRHKGPPIKNFLIGTIDDPAIESALLSDTLSANENEIMLNRFSQGAALPAASPLAREMKKIMHKPSLRLMSLLDLLERTPFQQLCANDVKTFIRTCLFIDASLLVDELRSSSSFRKQIHAFIAQTVNHAETPLSEAHFWSLLGLQLETHAVVALGKGFNRDYIDAIQSKLAQLQPLSKEDQMMNCALRCYAAGVITPDALNNDQIVELVRSYFYFCFLPKTEWVYWLRDEISHQWAVHLPSIHRVIRSDPLLFQQCMVSLEPFLGIESTNIIWTNPGQSHGRYLGEAYGVQYCVDFINGQVFTDTIPVKAPEDAKDILSEDEIKRALGTDFNLNSLVAIKEGAKTRFVTPDNQIRIEVEPDSVPIYKTMDLGEGLLLYRYVSEAWMLVANALQVPKLPHPRCIGWETVSQPIEKSHTMLIGADGFPYAKIFRKNPSDLHYSVVKVDREGKCLQPTQYLQKSQLGIVNNGVDRLGEMISPFFWVTEPTAPTAHPSHKQEWIVSRIDFLSIGLTFSVDKLGRAICDRYPDYFLAPNQSHSIVHGCKGALLLQHVNDASRHAILLLNVHSKKTERYSGPPQWDFEKPEQYYHNPAHAQEPFYLYPINPQTGTLNYDSPEAFLLLIRLLRDMRFYRETAVHLSHFQMDQPLAEKKGAKINAWKTQILNLLDQPYRTPADVALNLKFYVLIARFFPQLITYEQCDPLAFHDRFKKEMIENMSRYYEVISSVPSFLKLSSDEEMLIFDLMGKETYSLGLGMNRLCKKCNEEGSEDTLSHTAVHYENRHLMKHCLSLNFDFSKRRSYYSEMHQLRSRNTVRSNEFRPQDLNNYFFANYLHLLEEVLSAPKGLSQIDYDIFHLAATAIHNARLVTKEVHINIALLYAIRHSATPEKYKAIYDLYKDDCNSLHIMLNKLLQKARPEFANFLPAPIERSITVSRSSAKKNPSSSYKILPTLPIPSFNEMWCALPLPETPMKNDCLSWFESIQTSPQTSRFVLEKIELQDPLASSILQDIKGGYTPSSGSSYKLDDAYSPQELVDRLEVERLRLKGLVESLKEKVHHLANRPDSVDLDHLSTEEQIQAIERMNAIFSDSLQLLTIDDLYRAVMFADTTLLIQNNPFLSDKEALNTLLACFFEFMLARTALDQISNALSEAKKALNTPEDSNERSLALSEAGAILHKKRRFDPRDQPILLAYEFATGLSLRPEQVELVLKIIDLFFSKELDKDNRLNRLFFEFQAGGGKTKVLAALLAVLAIQKGLCPVFISLPETHDVTKEDFRSSIHQVLGTHVETIDILLSTHPSVSDLKKLYEKLKRGFVGKKAFIMTPEAYHALNLELQKNFYSRNRSMVAYLLKIMNFFETKCLFLMDETHLNGQSLQQANIPLGTPKALPEYEQALYATCTRILTGQTPYDALSLPDGRLLTEVVRLRENRQALLTNEEDKKQVLNLIQYHLLKFIGISEAEAAELKSFMLNKNAPMPHLLRSWKASRDSAIKAKASLVALTRGIVLETLPHALSLTCHMNYGPSIYPNDYVEAPKNKTKDTSTRFENPDVALAVSCQARYQRGITSIEEMRMLLQGYQREFETHLRRGKIKGEIAIYNDFLRWQSAYAGDEITLDSNFESDAVVEELIQRIGKEPALVHTFLIYHVLPKVTVYPYKLTSTAADLANSCRAAIFFSATLGIKELYPYLDQDQKFLLDRPFRAAVIQRSCEPQNSTVYTMPMEGPQAFFEAIFKQDPHAFEEINGLIDVGGWNKETPTEEYARTFLRFINQKKADSWNFAGVVYFKESNHVKQRYFLSAPYATPIPVPTHDIAQFLASRGIQGQRAFILLGPRDATGTDLILPPMSKFLITLGENTDLSNLVQGIMRLRQFLLPGSQQTIAWAIPDALSKEILQQTNLPKLEPMSCFAWTILQEARLFKKAIIARAIQEIQGAYRGYAMKTVRTKKSSGKRNKNYSINFSKAEAQMAQFDKYSKWFYFSTERNPLQLYCGEIGEKETEEVLQGIADAFAAKIQLSDRPEVETLKIQIKQIISQTKRLICTIDSKGGSLASEQQQESKNETLLQSQAQINENRSSSLASELLPYTYQELSCNTLLGCKDVYNLIKYSRNIISANSDLKTSLFSQHLYLLKNTISTCNTDKRKPIEHILVLQTPSGRFIFGLSYHDAEIYKMQIADLLPADLDGVVNQVGLFTSRGLLVVNGLGKSALSGDMDTLRNEPWFASIIGEIALYNGKIVDFQRIASLIERNYEGVSQLWREIVAKQWDFDPKSHALMQTLLEEYRRNHPQQAKYKLVGQEYLTGNSTYSDQEYTFRARPWQEPGHYNFSFNRQVSI